MIESKDSQQHHTACTENESDEEDDEGGEDDSETFEVDKILSICYGDPNETKKSGLYFKVFELLDLCLYTYIKIKC